MAGFGFWAMKPESSQNVPDANVHWQPTVGPPGIMEPNEAIWFGSLLRVRFSFILSKLSKPKSN